MTSPPQSGIKTVFTAAGIPASWLEKRPKLPSRNWLIFLSITSTVTGYYIYDRRQCKAIRQKYIERVKHLAEEPLNVMESARKVRVYGCKWPGDEDHEQSIKYFRKYVKPILVAAAVDYEMVNGARHGDLTRRISEEIQSKRRLELGIDVPPDIQKVLPTYKAPMDRRARELTGGTIIMGRTAFKEFMEGTKRGWTGPLDIVDHEELLANELQNDGHFDEPADAIEENSAPSQFPSAKTSPVFSVLQSQPPPKPPVGRPKIAVTANETPAIIPPQPPLLLVPFVDHIGFTQIPIMLWDWFNQRKKVKAGSAAAYALIKNETRPFIGPNDTEEPLFSDITTTPSKTNVDDLSFDSEAETWFKTSLAKIPVEIIKARTAYYAALPEKLATARALARGTREATKEEIANPPPTETELHAQRAKREMRWRRDQEGWDIVKPEAPVAWDERYRNALRVFVNPEDVD